MAILLDTRADPEARDIDGCTPLIIAAWSGFPRLVRLLAERKVDLEARDMEGFTALARAFKARLGTPAWLHAQQRARPGLELPKCCGAGSRDARAVRSASRAAMPTPPPHHEL